MLNSEATERIEIGKLLKEGKTKKVWEVSGKKGLVVLENKDTITKFDDPEQTQILPGKGALCTQTTCRVFELLQRCGILCAYIYQSSDTCFVAETTEMIPLEVVIRNKGFGSWLLRNPHVKLESGQKAVLFEKPVFELFLKTTDGKLVICGNTIVEGLDPALGQEDPWITQPYHRLWELWHPKKPLNNPDGDLSKCGKIYHKDVLPSAFGNMPVYKVEMIARHVNDAITLAWKKLGYDLIDLKIELGINSRGIVVVSDVIDADSWRLWDENGNDCSKQSFRDGEPLEQVMAKYQLVAELVQKFA